MARRSCRDGHAGYPEEIPVRREPLIYAPLRVQGLPDSRLRPTAFLWSGPHLQNTDTAHQIVVEGTLGPAIQVVHILGGAAPSRITRHDLLPDHLVRIEPVEKRRREHDAAEVGLLDERQVDRVEDRIQPVAVRERGRSAYAVCRARLLDRLSDR